MIHGIIPALLASYDEDGAQDVGRSLAAVDKLIEAGIDGVFLCGSTAEFPLHTIDERKRLIDAVTGHVAGRISVIAHVGAPDTRSSKELAAFSSAVGVTAVAAVTPHYFDYDEAAYTDYYRALADSIEVPLLAYQIPSLAHARLSTEWFAARADEGVLSGVKYTSSDLHQLADLRRIIGQDFTILNGADQVLLGGLALGADGGVGSTYNAIPRTYVELYRAFQAGDLVTARARQDESLKFIAAQDQFDFIAFLREALQLRGVPMGRSRAPLPMLSASQTAHAHELLAQFGIAASPSTSEERMP
ncbi:dihydrodipicolinate synthase family protein [Microbacterium sp. NPDC058342]|uniref:dihydrodipicolinate synthase family protein n=1 Tax=Microbacterium sp. NPDC058342 TaxID=3346454 RepID=UPI00365F5CBE